MKATLEYEGPARLVANQRFAARLHVHVGTDLAPGARIVIAVRHMSDFGDGQTTDPHAENYVEIISPEPAAWEFSSGNAWDRHPWNRGMELTLAAGTVAAGQTVTVCLGGRDEGRPNYRCQSFAETHFRFRLGIDADGTDRWEVADAAGSPGPEIVGAEASRLAVTVSDVTGDARCVHVKAEDVYGNVAGSAGGSVALLLDDARVLGRVDLTGQKAATLPVEVPADAGPHVITAAGDDGRLFARSNPVGPSPLDGYHLYWGEIHAQSGLCDGTNSPESLYAYARDTAGLDFAAVTSHDNELTARDWQEIQHATQAAHQPGRFVTFLGYEWSGPTDEGGDNNVYFLGDEGPLLYSRAYHNASGWDVAEGATGEGRTLHDVVEALRGTDAMIVPHCGGRQCNFDFYDAPLMPLFEIHSCHRNYENVAFETIDRGLQFGFIGGSDDHRGAIGDSHPTARERFFSGHNGLVAVYARQLTREALWEAFFARRVYATNGSRPVLDVRVNEAFIGGRLTTDPGTRLHVTFRAWLDGMLDRVEVVRGTQTVDRQTGRSNRHPVFEGEFLDAAPSEPTPYYVRVIQTDGGTAWSSPVWVGPGE